MEQRQAERFSQNRKDIIEKMIVDRALKPIKDDVHARSIFTAHLRHQQTDYQDLIDKAKGDFRMKEVARDFARVVIRDKIQQAKDERKDIYEKKQEVEEEKPIKERKKKIKKEKIADR